MSIQHHAETLRLQPPRTARFLRRSIPPRTDTWMPRDAGLRAEQHRRGTAGPKGWPIRLTDCGEDPGKFGDNPLWRTLQEAR